MFGMVPRLAFHLPSQEPNSKLSWILHPQSPPAHQCKQRVMMDTYIFKENHRIFFSTTLYRMRGNYITSCRSVDIIHQCQSSLNFRV